jgi:hypothetical protein
MSSSCSRSNLSSSNSNGQSGRGRTVLAAQQRQLQAAIAAQWGWLLLQTVPLGLF